jgi:hypothetical protein
MILFQILFDFVGYNIDITCLLESQQVLKHTLEIQCAYKYVQVHSFYGRVERTNRKKEKS